MRMKLFKGLKLGKRAEFNSAVTAKQMIAMGENWVKSVRCMNKYHPEENEHEKIVLVANQNYSPAALKKSWQIAGKLKDTIHAMNADQRRLVFLEIAKVAEDSRRQVREVGTFNCPAGDVMKGCNALSALKADVEKEELRDKLQNEKTM